MCNVYHGDLKTSNIVINAAREITVIDWGSVHVSTDLVKYESCTAQYASPEALSVLSGGDGYSPESLLVWSLGVILYELLTTHCLVTSYQVKKLYKIGEHFNGVEERSADYISKMQQKIDSLISKSTTDENIRWLLYMTLRLNPRKRCFLSDIYDFIQNPVL